MRTRLAIKYLKELNYPLVNIRRALPKLTGINHAEIAEITGVKPATVSHYLEGIRKNPEIQKKIANIWRTPPADLFEEYEGRQDQK